MNERIKELWEEGTFTVVPREGDYAGVSAKNIEKFAELIVRECRDMFVVNSSSWNLLNEKLDHFGVEE